MLVMLNLFSNQKCAETDLLLSQNSSSFHKSYKNNYSMNETSTRIIERGN